MAKIIGKSSKRSEQDRKLREEAALLAKSNKTKDDKAYEEELAEDAAEL